MSATMEEVHVLDYLDLNQIDPNFDTIKEDYYNFRITSAEVRSYGPTEKSPHGGKYINMGFTITGDPTFTGRRIYESLFPNNFILKVLRRIQDATGIDQAGNTEAWCKALATTQPTLKLKVANVPDVMRDGSPNERTKKADGSAGLKSVIDWKAGVQPGD